MSLLGTGVLAIWNGIDPDAEREFVRWHVEEHIPERVGLPGFLAWPIMLAELIGGLAILLGFYGRYVSLLLIPVLLGALMVHAPNGWVFNAPNGGWEYPAFMALTAFAHALIGDGALAIRPERQLVQAKAALA